LRIESFMLRWLCGLAIAFWGASMILLAQQAVGPDGVASIQVPKPRIVPPSPEYRVPSGTTLVFTAEWHLFNAGTTTMKLERNGAAEKLTAIAVSAGTVNLFFPVHDRFETQFDPKTFCTTRVFKHMEEGRHGRETQIQLDPAGSKSILDERNLKTGEIKHEENDAPACSTDVMSGFFYLGSLPLKPGVVENFPVTDGGKTTIAMARVEGREDVKVAAGAFHTVRVAVEATSGKYQGKGQLLIWFTDDPNHLPVKMRARVQWGTILFKLQAVHSGLTQ
jgi:Protein of unknown function (DUF3108)